MRSAESPRTSAWEPAATPSPARSAASPTPESIAEFPTLAELSEGSIVNHVAIINRFAADGVIGEMDCFYSLWMTDRAPGFTDDEIAALQRLAPFLGLAIKCVSLARIAQTLVESQPAVCAFLFAAIQTVWPLRHD